ncbi:MAG: EAL domain-containing protein [Arcobacter sp.]|uniref:EAL domain-containing protein n=1 Tax=Arcobacter sp. TaxID=1872629 RepID=UPI003B0036A1
MNKYEFKYLIINAKYKTKYEVIIDINNNEIYGYEALSTFEIDKEIINTEEIFRQLHHNNELFFDLEKRNKQLQIKNFEFHKKLFLNFDADIFITEEQKEFWENFLTNNRKDIVVEITENGSDDESSSKSMRDFSFWLKQMNINAALDDFGQEGSMFSFFIMNNSQYIKIDKSFIKQIRANKNYIHYLKGLLLTIQVNNKKSIIEGIETKEDLELAKKLGCDYVQGYYFKDYNIIR